MTTILERIKIYKHQEVSQRKSAIPLATLDARAKAAPKPRGFASALQAATKTGYGLIA